MKNKRILFVLLFTFCSLSISSLFMHREARGGSVIPMGESQQPTTGVKSLFEKENQGSVQPLTMEVPGVRRIMAEGFATILNGNVEQARISALRMAYAEAVGRVTGLQVSSLTWIVNVRQVIDVVSSRSTGFIRSYDVVREGLSEKDPGRYEVLIEAEVVEKSPTLEDERLGLNLFLKLLGDPKLLIMLPEKAYQARVIGGHKKNAFGEEHHEVEVQSKDTRIRIKSSERRGTTVTDQGHAASGTSEQGTVMGSAEAALAQAFSTYGYQVITSDDLLAQGLVDPKVLHQAKAGVTAQAVKVARAAGADLALLGVMRVSQDMIKPVGVKMVMVTAEASAKALIVSSGKMIRAFHEVKRAAAPTELKAYADCLDKAANGIASVLAWKIPQILTRENRHTRLVVHGIDLHKAEILKNALSRADGVSSIRFAKIPTKGKLNASYVLLTGFVRLPPEQIIKICRDTLKTPLVLVTAGKYEIEISQAGEQVSHNLPETRNTT